MGTEQALPQPLPQAGGGIRFAGYASVFDRVDRGGDIVRRGAFAASLRAGGAVPLLWQHRPGAVVGVVEALAEDARGLRVVARVTHPTAAGLVARGALTGLSFGYRVRAARGERPRELLALDLAEVSLVARPMQALARVIAVEPSPPRRRGPPAFAGATRFFEGANGMDDMEVKADALDGAFDAVLAAEAVDELKASVAALKAQVERQAVAASRLPLDGAKADDPARDAFVERYLRRGIDAGVEMKSLSGASGAEGGYAVPREIDGAIAATLKALSPIRSIATVVQTGTSGYRKLVATGSMGAGWVGETDARPVTATRGFAEIVPPSGELYANPAASQAMLDDAMFDVEGWLADELAREFAVAEGAAFVGGNGTNRPKGFLSYATTNESDGARAFGTLQYIASGAAGGFAASNPQDKLVELVHALKAPYRQGACWVMNSDTLARVRKFKTTDGAFLWQPGLVEGQAASLLGYPVVEAEDMPDVAANSLSIAFGNFRAGYLIADRGETRILRDPFSNKPFVHFYATKRVGGAIIDSQAIKLMKFAAS